jgi:curved DNA-binding protein
MDYRDYYKVLGVKRDASQPEIKRAFRKLAREHHPDLKPGDSAAERRFKEVNEANEVLSDPGKRRKYDTLGANWEALSRAGAAGADPFAGFRGEGGGGVRYEFRSSGDAGGFSDFFRTFFGGGASGATASAGGGRRRGTGTADAGRSYDEILAGLGLGAAGATSGGGSAAGRTGVTSAPRSVEAEVELTLEEAYHGTTRIVEIDGKRLEVSMPRGVETGSRIRLKGRGGGDPGHPADLHLVARVRPHSVFSRTGADLRRELPITLGEALLGAELPVGTLKGRILLTIPPGTQGGRTFRLKGQGMPLLKPRAGEPATGDLLVRIRVVLPTKLGADALAAARRLVELADQPDPRAAGAGTPAGTHT